METQKKEIVIPHVQGNVLTLSIPLDVTKVSVVNGKPEKVKVPYVPVNPVTVFLTCGNYTVKKAAVMDESVTNLAHVEFGEELKCGVYSITVRTKGAHNEPMRFKQRSVVEVFDTTREAGIAPGVEFDSDSWILEAAVYFGGISISPEETDPQFANSPAAGITAEDIARWNAGGSGGSGYNVTFDNGNVIFSGSNQPTFNNGNIIF